MLSITAERRLGSGCQPRPPFQAGYKSHFDPAGSVHFQFAFLSQSLSARQAPHQVLPLKDTFRTSTATRCRASHSHCCWPCCCCTGMWWIASRRNQVVVKMMCFTSKARPKGSGINPLKKLPRCTVRTQRRNVANHALEEPHMIASMSDAFHCNCEYCRSLT